MTRKESLHDNLVRLQRKDRSLLHVLIDVNGLWEKGKLVHSRWFVRDVTRRVELEKEILAISDQERQQMGQDLHDDLCQQLTSIEFLTRALEQKLQANSPAESAQAKEISQLTRRAITHARDLARGMFPVEYAPERPGGSASGPGLPHQSSVPDRLPVRGEYLSVSCITAQRKCTFIGSRRRPSGMR